MSKEKEIKELTEKILKLEDELWELKKQKLKLKRESTTGSPGVIFKGSGYYCTDN